MKKTYKIFRYISFIVLLLCITISCEKTITDFGFDGSISGTVKDASGKIVPGDITSNNLLVKALLDGDEVAIDLRVQGDGTFQNTKLFPGKFTVSISGPIFNVEPIIINLSGGKSVVNDFTIVPYITIDSPVISGNPASTSVTINFRIKGNQDKVPSKREIYCSTVAYPTATIGSGPFYQTITKGLDIDEGSASVEGLTPNTKYYLRIGAQASGAGMNYSEQIVFNTSN